MYNIIMYTYYGQHYNVAIHIMDNIIMYTYYGQHYNVYILCTIL